jgi:hypothetical protein
MTNRSTLAVSLVILCPLGIAAWILGTHTIGISLSPNNDVSIGFAVALLAVLSAGYLFLFSQMTERPGSRLGQTLIICGTACVLVALALQFYLAAISSENSRRGADILNESVRIGRPMNNVNINTTFPKSVEGIGYLALLAGIWLAGIGIWVGVGQPARNPKIGAEEQFMGSSAPMNTVETGIRQANS